MLKENFDTLQPLSSTSSSYSTSSSSSSCSSTSSTSSNFNMEQKNCRCDQNMQNNLVLVMNDLKQICTNLSLITRQIDQVVNKIETKFGNSDVCNKENSNESLKCLKDFTKIINNNIANLKDFDSNKTSRQLNRNTSNRNENIINNYLNDKTVLERKSNEHFSKVNLWNPMNKNDTFQRSKCTRSKSQPAFKETQAMPPSSTNTNLNRFSIFDPNRMTSSPICNPQISESNGDSSFYEDQLDNELESIESNPNEAITVIKASSSLIKNDAPYGIQKSRPKSSNSNYHVSFNINNAIYTSKQETPIPIPISILKQGNQNKMSQNDQPINSSSSSSSCSPLQPSLKKSPGINFNSNDASETKKLSNQSKSVRIDTKTTIL